MPGVDHNAVLRAGSGAADTSAATPDEAAPAPAAPASKAPRKAPAKRAAAGSAAAGSDAHMALEGGAPAYAQQSPFGTPAPPGANFCLFFWSFSGFAVRQNALACATATAV